MNENHQLGNYKDQLRQLERELEIANKNREMFSRLWIRWKNESNDIGKAIMRVKNNIEEMKRHPQ